MVLLFLWGPLVNRIWPPIEVEPGAVELAGTNDLETASLPPGTDLPTSSVSSTTAVLAPPQAPDEEELLQLENDLFRLTLTSDGGGVKLVELKNYPRHVTRKARNDTSLATLNEGALLPVLSIANYRSHYAWKRNGQEGATATTTWTNGLVVTRELELSSNYLFKVRVRLENPTDGEIRLPELAWSLGASTPLGSSLDSRFTGLVWFDGKAKEATTDAWFENRFLGCFPGTPRNVFEAGSSNVVWAGVQNQFFTLLTIPDVPATKIQALRFPLPPPTPDDLAVNPRQPTDPKGHQTSLLYAPDTIPAGKYLERNFTVYAGPKEYTTLSRIAYQQENKLDLVMNFSGFFGYFAKPLLVSMNGLNHRFGLGYGVAIVVITVLIKLIFWPLTNASTKSMKRMARLQPQMKEIQEKYKEDPQKMQRKLMEFMKENKVNPMGSCLPLLLQMPIFIGFYTMLQSAIELRGASFLWIPDLSSPDTLFFLPVLGLPFNLMPLIMGGTMLYQARLTPASPGMDPAQQTMMRYMPLMFMFILYGMSSGLTLYWTVQNLLSIVQTKLTRTDDPATGTPVAARPGKAPANSGRKKKH